MSLKDKRRIIKSLKDRIAFSHNVSIAEVGRTIRVELDVPQAVLSFGGAGIARKDGAKSRKVEVEALPQCAISSSKRARQARRSGTAP